jgi:hypothetical protein
MAKMLLINPGRRAKRKAPVKRRATASTVARRRRNPLKTARTRTVTVNAMTNPVRRRRHSSVARRRRNPASLVNLAPMRSRRRRSNPIGGRLGLGGIGRKIMSMAQDAAIGAVGAVAVDVAMGYANRFLPSTLQRTPGRVGVGDAVKAVLTVVAGHLLHKPTKGMSTRAAQGALTVQAHQIATSFLPAGMTLGYYSPARVMQGQSRVGPNRAVFPGHATLNRYVRPGATPLLNRYVRPGATPLLNGTFSSSSERLRNREGVMYR